MSNPVDISTVIEHHDWPGLFRHDANRLWLRNGDSVELRAPILTRRVRRRTARRGQRGIDAR
jgi:hypothetical protein